MNNTTTKRNLALAAVFIAATLLVGTVAVTTTIATTEQSTAFAYSKKGADKKDGGGNDNGNTVTIEDCKNKGSASGFDTAVDQECENLICTHPGGNATCVQEGAVTTTSTATTPPPVKLTCEQCFTKFLNADQIFLLTRGSNDFALLCNTVLPTLTAEQFQNLLLEIRVSPTVAAQLIQCLIDAGVQFGTRPT